MKVSTALKGLPCIYKITNSIDGKIYIGKAKCLVKRSYNYNSSFRQNRHDHINDYLFNAMTIHGYENFKIEPIEFCKLEELEEKELKWILNLESTDRSYGYNLRLDSSTGMIASPETIIKMKNNLTAQWASGVRDGHSEKLKQSWQRNPERRAIIGQQFSKTLTKYEYMVTFENWTTEICNYKRLKELKLHSVLSTLWRKNLNKVTFKGCYIEKVKI